MRKLAEHFQCDAVAFEQNHRPFNVNAVDIAMRVSASRHREGKPLPAAVIRIESGGAPLSGRCASERATPAEIQGLRRPASRLTLTKQPLSKNRKAWRSFRRSRIEQVVDSIIVVPVFAGLMLPLHRKGREDIPRPVPPRPSTFEAFDSNLLACWCQ